MTVQPHELPTDRPLGELESVAHFDGPMLTGVTVSHAGRIFVNFPKWGDDVEFTVAEVRDGREVPFPNAEIIQAEKAVSDVNPDDYDALIVPGGTVGADNLRGSQGAVAFMRGFFEQAKPVGVICHGPWTLVEADVVKGRTLTSYPTLQTDIRNAGGEWIDEEVVTDQGLVTSRNPDDIPAFCAKIVEEFAEGKHAEQSRSA